MDVSELRSLVAAVGAANITLSSHLRQKAAERGIKVPEILEKLREGKDIIEVDDQGDAPEGHKYAILFKKLSFYDLKVVISVKKDMHINIVTAHIQNIKKRKARGKWLGT